MDYLERAGKTVEEAISAALAELKLERSDVDVEVLEAPSKGFLGFGQKLARVRVSPKAPEEDLLEGFSISLSLDPEEKKNSFDKAEKNWRRDEAPLTQEILSEAEKTALEFVQDVAQKMGVPVEVSSELNDQGVYITLTGDHKGLLIGKRGQTLDSFQYLTGLAVYRATGHRVRITLDVEGYRERRKETLENLARRFANQAVEWGSKIILEPMNPHERRLIHVALQEDDRLKTSSEGEEPFRKVVIIPNNLKNEQPIYAENLQRRNRDGDSGRDRRPERRF